MANVALELIAQDPHGLRVAAQVGAQRVELCCALEVGGLTPSIALIDAAVAARDRGGAQVHVLVRPRAGGFEYDEAEANVLVADCVHAVAHGADGVVVGGARHGVLDLGLIERVAAVVGPASVTVHRVVDTLADPVAAVESLRDLRVRRVLTSGGAQKAPDGVATITAMVAAAHDGPEIMAGGGVSVESVPALIAAGVSAIHTSASSPVAAGYVTTDASLAERFRAAVSSTASSRAR